MFDSFDFSNIYKLFSEEQINKRFQDGRISSHFMEDFICEHYNLNQANNCQKYFDATDKNNQNKFEIKCLTKRGLSITPSNMKGQGRKFNQKLFKEICLETIYIICDITNFPNVKMIFIPGNELYLKSEKGSFTFETAKSLFR